jgi:glycosyltransferase involved in cell wall biosynthesis
MQNRPKVAMVATRMDVGGVPDHLLTLIHELKPRFDITLVTGDVDRFNGTALADLAIPVIRLDSFRRLPDLLRDPRLVLQLARIFREGRYDIVHTHMSKAALAGALAARLVWPRPRLVNTAHNLGSIALNQPVLRWAYSQYDRLLLGGMTDKVIVVSDAIHEKVKDLGIIPPSRLHSIQNGIHTAKFAVEGDASRRVREEFGIAPEDVMIVTLARLVWFKGVDMLIDATEILGATHPNAKVVICGDGVLREKLEARARAKGLDGRFFFAGIRRDIPEVLAAADIFALPSVSEGLPIAILEAMAAGLPLVCTAVDGVPEVVLHEKVGLLSPARDPAAFAKNLAALVADPAKRETFGNAARDRVQTAFSADRMARQTAAVYEDMLRRTSAQSVAMGQETA